MDPKKLTMQVMWVLTKINKKSNKLMEHLMKVFFSLIGYDYHHKIPTDIKCPVDSRLEEQKSEI